VNFERLDDVFLLTNHRFHSLTLLVGLFIPIDVVDDIINEIYVFY